MAQTGGKRLSWGETLLFWTMVLASFVLGFAVAVLPDCRRSLALEQRLDEMRQANDQMAAHVAELDREKQALEKDPFYVEKMARRALNLRRPGEVTVISLVPSDPADDETCVKPHDPPGSVLCEVMSRLEPFATNRAVRLLAVVLALANLLVAFVLFGRDDSRSAVPTDVP